MRWHSAIPHLAVVVEERINMDALFRLRVQQSEYVNTRFVVVGTTIAGVDVTLYEESGATYAAESQAKCEAWLRRLVELS